MYFITEMMQRVINWKLKLSSVTVVENRCCYSRSWFRTTGGETAESSEVTFLPAADQIRFDRVPIDSVQSRFWTLQSTMLVLKKALTRPPACSVTLFFNLSLLSVSVSDVGKSSLLLRFADNSFSGELMQIPGSEVTGCTSAWGFYKSQVSQSRTECVEQHVLLFGSEVESFYQVKSSDCLQWSRAVLTCQEVLREARFCRCVWGSLNYREWKVCPWTHRLD